MKHRYGAYGVTLTKAVAVAVLVLPGVLMSSASTARAEFIGDLVTVEVSSSQGSAEVSFPLGQLPPQVMPVGWVLPERVELRSTEGHLLGIIEDLEVELIGDPLVNISFSAAAGGADATFSISSATVSFSPMNNPSAWASATVTLTDSGTNGASMDPVAPATGLFKAEYNGSTVFAELIGSQSLSGGGSVTDSAAIGPQTILGAVSSIRAGFKFTLSAEDSASGTGQFEVVPEPATLLLLSMGALSLVAFAWRKRHCGLTRSSGR